MAPVLMLVSTSLDFLLFMKHTLETDGFEVALAGDFSGVSEQVELIGPVAVIVDCSSSMTLSRNLCLDLKNAAPTRDIAFIPLVESGADTFHLEMIRAGADRCFHRPFDPIELLEYLRSRFTDRSSNRQNVLKGGGIELDVRTRRVTRDGVTLRLGMLEFALLQLFLERPGVVMRRDELIAGGWPASTFVDYRTVDVRIGLLRKALHVADQVSPIRTVRGVGYVFDTEG